MTTEEKYKALLALEWGSVKNSDTSSWAVWKEPKGDLSIVKNLRSNIKDVSMFDKNRLGYTLGVLKMDCVFVGLNASEGNDDSVDKTRPWYSFHSAKPRGNDYKLRWALMENRVQDLCWGSYITDIFKDFKRTDSNDVVKYYTNPQNNGELETQLKRFNEELNIIKPKRLIVMGVAAKFFVCKYYSNMYNITPINHYACNKGCEAYREYVKGELF